MFIQTEETPNPATLKFLPGREVMASGVADFTSAEAAAERSPLANNLFSVDGVKGVFLGTDFITVTKSEERVWQTLKPMILGAIMDHYTSGQPAIGAASHTASEVEFNDDGLDPEIISQIKELIDTRVRPAVAQDGGDIVYRGFKGGTVYLNMRGSCAGCPSSTATLKMGIENMLKHYVPEVLQVEAIQ
jgi:Fe-S cluster biogenesis protein NfuA